MNEVPDTEWFSAYLDGELTADEQLRVEKMLAASPEARQLLEEFRALGTTLQNLPPRKLGEDLSRQVLEAAERRMLAASDSQGDAREQERAKPAASRAAETLKPRWREISRHGLPSLRALAWSGIAVAVAFLLSFMLAPEHKIPDQIAMTQNLDGKNRGIGRDEGGTDGSAAPSVAGNLTMQKKLAEGRPDVEAVPATTAASPSLAKAGGGNGGRNGPVGDNSPPVLLVNLSISPAAARQRTFEGLLTGLGMADLQDPVAAHRGHNGGYREQNSPGQATLLRAASGQTSSLDVGKAQRDIAPQSGSAAIDFAAPAPANQGLAAAKTGANNDRLGTNAQQPHGGPIGGNVRRAGSPPQIVYDIDATGAQVFAVLQQIAQKPDAFSPPVIQSAARADDNNGESPSLAIDRARQEVAEATKDAKATKAAKDLGEKKKEESLGAARPQPVKSGAATFAMPREPAERQEARQDAAVATHRVRFVLQVVDQWPKAQPNAAELPPAAAAPAPAAFPAAPAKP